VQEFVLSVMRNLLGVLENCIRRMLCVSIRIVALTMEVAPRASQASREGGCGVAGWQDLKTESGNIADLTPRARQD
jgi:hypothetical protein